MSKFRFIFVFILMIVMISLTSCIQEKATNKPLEEKAFEPYPSTTARLFASGTISTSLNQRDATLSPDGNEFYYTVMGPQGGVIVFVTKQPNGWSKPEVASFSGTYNDIEPVFAPPDGQRMYFSSNRPTEDSTEINFDIWYVEKQDLKWSQPINAGPNVNSPADEFFPSLTENGALYFTSERNEGIGAEDIYVCRTNDKGWMTPELLPENINSDGYEFNAFVAPDESYLIFSSYNRPDGLGGGDLYIAFKSDSGWTDAINMGPTVNSPRLDYSPTVSLDGQWLFFTSTRIKANIGQTKPVTYPKLVKTMSSPENGVGDIYWINASIIDSLRRHSR